MSLYGSFVFVLAVASVVVSCLVTCATCCAAAIPYVGTVILLPVFVLLRLFSLLFLRQFGPDYDVWADFVPREFLPILAPLPSVPLAPGSLSSPPSSQPPPTPQI